MANGEINLDNSDCSYGLALDTAGNYPITTFGVELWVYLAGGRPIVNKYGDLLADTNWCKEATYSNRTAYEGTFTLGVVAITEISLDAPSYYYIAMAFWNSNAASYSVAQGAKTAIGVWQNMIGSTIPSTLNDTQGETGFNGADIVMTLPQTPTMTLVGIG